MQLSDVDFHDIQAVVRFGHGHLEEARFYVLTIADADAARAWLAAAKVSSAVRSDLPDTALQVAFTYDGLRALGMADEILDQFSHEFRTGMYEENRSRRLGDLNANDPSSWDWGGPDKIPHLLVMIYAKPGRFARWEIQVKGERWTSAFKELASLCTKDIGDNEPFGFVDGTSQPKIDWEQQKSTRRGKSADYSNVSALGEFLLGYPNEYGRYTDRPLLDADDHPVGSLPLAEDEPGKLDLGRNGTYLVFRDLAQDVPAFWKFMDQQACNGAEKRRKLASAMVGRMPKEIPIIPNGYEIIPNDDPKRVIPEGAPLARLRNRPIDGVGPDMKDIWLNQFTYHSDLSGTACPHGAHIRRANPRTGDLPSGARGWISRAMRTLGFGNQGPHSDLVSSTRFHRILRRGREYGEEIEPDDAVKGKGRSEARGLRFICLNANISRQFEFVQSSWIENPKFEGIDHGDPLLGSRAPLRCGSKTDSFSIPQDSGLSCDLAGLPQFVTVRGGAYFFLPGLRALRFIARH